MNPRAGAPPRATHRARRGLRARPVPVFLLRRWIDDARDVSRPPEHELHRTGEELRGLVGRLPRRNVVLDGRQHVGRGGDTGDVDRFAREGEAAGLAQPISDVHVAHDEGVHRGRHVGRIAVPEQEVECGRLLAEQIAVHPERPDEIVGPHRPPGVRDLLTGEIALSRNGGFEGGKTVLVDEHPDRTHVGEVDHGREVRGAGEPRVAPGVKPRRQCAQEYASKTVSDRVHLPFSGGAFDGLERCQRPFQHVAVEALVGERRIRVHPRDDEHRMALADEPLDHGVFGAQIHHVELVHPRGDEEHRPAADRLGGRRVLDELDEIVLKDHLARRCRDGLADREGVRRAHADVEPTGLRVQVTDELPHALDGTRPCGFEGGPDRFRVRREEVRRSEGIGHLPGCELEPTPAGLVETRDCGWQRHEGARVDEICLLQHVQPRDVVPGAVPETAIVLVRTRCRLRFDTDHARGAVCP